MAALVVALAALFWVAPALAERKTMDLQARKHFAAGEYQKALGLFAELYAETQHPTYLRNIARCHQSMGDPDKAIVGFREYLRKAKGLTADQKAEVDKFIAEMEELKRSNAAAAVKTEPAAPLARTTDAGNESGRGDDPPTKPPPAAEPKGEGRSLPSNGIVFRPAKNDADATAPIYTRWWFWGGVGAVAVGAVAAALILSANGGYECGSLGCGDLTSKAAR